MPITRSMTKAKKNIIKVEDDNECFFCLENEKNEQFMIKKCGCKGKINLHEECYNKISNKETFLDCTICKNIKKKAFFKCYTILSAGYFVFVIVLVTTVYYKSIKKC